MFDCGTVKLAVVGKGGSGKTVLVTLLARAFADLGHNVLAADLDFNPGLAVSLGLDAVDCPLPDEFVEERAGTPYGWTLAGDLSSSEALRRHGTTVDEQISYLGFGNVAHAVDPLRQFITAVRQVAEELNEPGGVVIMDLAAGPTSVYEGYARAADLVLVASDPTMASAIAVERILALLEHDSTPAWVVLTDPRDEIRLGPRAELPLDPIATVPFDPLVKRLEASGSLASLGLSAGQRTSEVEYTPGRGVVPVSSPMGGPALSAVRQLAAALGSRDAGSVVG